MAITREISGTVINICAVVFICVLYLPCVRLSPSSSELSNEAVHDDPFVIYPYRLSSTSPFGRISDSALPGSEVPVDTSLPHFEFTESSRYLKLWLSLNTLYFNQTDIKNNAKVDKPSLITKGNGHSGKGTMSASNETVLSTLPEGVRIDISGEKGNVDKVSERMAFTLDEHLHIVVGNSHGFKYVDGIEFWVVTIYQQKGHRDRVVSNPLSFVIKIDHDKQQKEGAALYAGIVVLIVCLFALLIPLTVRTKRRLREGKPLCACGSSSKKLEEHKREEEEAEAKAEAAARAETGNGSSVVVASGEKPSAAAVNGRDDLAMILEGKQSGKEHETIQSRNMRCLSYHHFQPHSRDPHYNNVYERPMFKHPPAASPPAKLSSPSRVSFASDPAKPSSSKSGEQQSKL